MHGVLLGFGQVIAKRSLQTLKKVNMKNPAIFLLFVSMMLTLGALAQQSPPFTSIAGTYDVSLSGKVSGSGIVTNSILPNGKAQRQSSKFVVDGDSVHLDFFFTHSPGESGGVYYLTMRSKEWKTNHNFKGHFHDGPVMFESVGGSPAVIGSKRYVLKMWISVYEKNIYHMGIDRSADSGKTWDEDWMSLEFKRKS